MPAKKLDAVQIPESVIQIGPDAFIECRNLKDITLPSSLRVIGGLVDQYEDSVMVENWGSVFTGCTALEEIKVSAENPIFFAIDGVLFTRESAYSEDGIDLVTYPANKANVSYTIPDGVANIGMGAFSGAQNIREVTISKGVVSLQHQAFAECQGIESIVLPEGVTTLGNAVFYDCRALKCVTLPDSLTNIDEQAIWLCDNLEGVICNKGSYAEEWAKRRGFPLLNAETVREGDWIAAIREDGKCTVISYLGESTEIVIPETIAGYQVVELQGKLFNKNSSITSAYIPDSVTTIGNNAFSECRSLVNIHLPENLTAISEYMLNGCVSLEQLVIPQSVTRIEGWSIQQCIQLKKLIIPDSVTYIGNCAFADDYELVEVQLPKYLVAIEGDIFYNCVKLQTLTIPEGVKSIGYCAFRNCNSLEKLYIPNSVKEIGENALDGCDALTIYCNRLSFAAQWAQSNSFDRVIYQDEEWEETVYEWSADYSTVTATKKHKTEPLLTQTETVQTTASVTTSPTELQKGSITYTASFNNDTFEKQTISVDIPALCELNVIYLPASTQYVGEKAFANLPCQAIIIPEGCASIASRAFVNCRKLIYIQIPLGTLVAEDALEGCGNTIVDYVE